MARAQIPIQFQYKNETVAVTGEECLHLISGRGFIDFFLEQASPIKKLPIEIMSSRKFSFVLTFVLKLLYFDNGTIPTVGVVFKYNTSHV